MSAGRVPVHRRATPAPPPSPTPLAPDERALTGWLGRFFAAPEGEGAVGIGDDAAVVVNTGRHTVVTCDPVVAGVHFEVGTDPARVGRKAVCRNLSDLAAMGAFPDWLLVSVLLPRANGGLGARDRRRLFAGVRAAAQAHGCRVVGGDVAATPGPLTVTVTAGGHLAGGRALLRSGAKPGDTIHVTGPLGGSRLGRHLRIRPRLAEGQWLARQRAVAAAIDVSDGLLLDLWTVLQASGGLGAELHEAAIPIAAAARRLASRSGRTPLAHALGDGEDHELLFTARGRLAAGGPLSARAKQPIGRVVATPGLWLCTRSGERRALAPAGWQHPLGAGAPGRARHPQRGAKGRP